MSIPLNAMRPAARINARGDEGVAMVLVLGIATIVAALVAVTMAMSLQSLKSSRQHVTFESAIAVAETGIDEILAEINTGYNSTPVVNWVNPAPCNWDVSGLVPFPTADTERAAARAKLLALAVVPGCLKSSGSGEYVAVHPTGNQTVYSMGFSPSYQAFEDGVKDAKARVIKAEYLFNGEYGGPQVRNNLLTTSLLLIY